MTASNIHATTARCNAAPSTGPVTAEGLARSSQNARKHDLFTNVSLLPGEDRALFDALLAEFTAEHKPATATERRYIREMADAELRLHRVRQHAAQAQINAASQCPDSMTPLVDAFQKLADTSKVLQLCLRYERHFQRQFDSALKTLLDLKKRSANTQRAEHKQAVDAQLKALEQMILAPTPGELYGYNDGGDDLDEDSNDTRQNELSSSPAHPPKRR